MLGNNWLAIAVQCCTTSFCTLSHSGTYFVSVLLKCFGECVAKLIFLVGGVFRKIVAQVYTRDATHRPTATSTPGRGAVPEFGVFGGPGGVPPCFREFREISGNFGKFSEISKKTRKKLSWKPLQVSFFVFFGGPGGVRNPEI